MQFQGRIWQRVGNAKILVTAQFPRHDGGVRAAAAQNKAAIITQVLAYSDEAPRADVAQFRMGRLIKVGTLSPTRSTPVPPFFPSTTAV